MIGTPHKFNLASLRQAHFLRSGLAAVTDQDDAGRIVILN